MGRYGMKKKFAAYMILFFALPAFGATDSAAHASATPAGSPSSKHRPEPAVPFGFQLGKTTLDEADQYWQQAGAKLVSRGYAAIGAGSGKDGWAPLADNAIVLVDVADTEFEITHVVRFAFYEGVLYSIQVKLADLLATRNERQDQFDEKAVAALESDLRHKYGPPTRALKDMFAKKKPDLLIWTFGQNNLVLYANTKGLSPCMLSFTNGPLQKQAQGHKKRECGKVVACSGYKK